VRPVYKLQKEEPDSIMRIIVVSVREDNEVYDIAAKREGR